MARPILRATLGVVTLLVVCSLIAAAPDDDPRFKQKLETVLAVQTALREGRDHLQRGNHQAAVYALERQVHLCGGDKDYLAALEAAYRGCIRELQLANRAADAAKYVERLAIIDPGSRLERNPPTLAAMASNTPAVQTPVKAPDKPAVTEFRAAIDHKNPEIDVFSDANRATPVDARAILAKAAEEFKQQRYQAAGRLYQQAHGLDPNATAACRECWAYCKLSAVVEALNQPNVTVAALPELEREVRQAMSMAPTLDKYGEPLLRTLQERGAPTKVASAVNEPRAEEPSIEFRHLPKQGQWSVVETSHFRILHNQPREMAEKAAKIAEQTRVAMSKKWFGDNGEAWTPRCDMYLHATGQDYSRATGVPAQSPGHSTIRTEGDRVVSRRVDLHCDDANMMVGVLPHETTHVVLAGRYNGHAVPRWADEGIAVLTEPRDRIDRHLRNLPKHRDERQLFNVGQLMEMNDYPKPQQIGPFYAQSVSVVEYLTSLKGAPAFTEFMRDGLRIGYEPALQKHFNIQGYPDLDRRWQAYAFGQQAAQNP